MRRTESGTLLLMKPGRMKWEYSEPAGKLFLLDGTFAWFYSHGDSQVQRIPAKATERSALAAAFSAGPHETGKGIEQPDPAARPERRSSR